MAVFCIYSVMQFQIVEFHSRSIIRNKISKAAQLVQSQAEYSKIIQPICKIFPGIDNNKEQIPPFAQDDCSN